MERNRGYWLFCLLSVSFLARAEDAATCTTAELSDPANVARCFYDSCVQDLTMNFEAIPTVGSAFNGKNSFLLHLLEIQSRNSNSIATYPSSASVCSERDNYKSSVNALASIMVNKMLIDRYPGGVPSTANGSALYLQILQAKTQVFECVDKLYAEQNCSDNGDGEGGSATTTTLASGTNTNDDSGTNDSATPFPTTNTGRLGMTFSERRNDLQNNRLLQARVRGNLNDPRRRNPILKKKITGQSSEENTVGVLGTVTCNPTKKADDVSGLEGGGNFEKFLGADTLHVAQLRHYNALSTSTASRGVLSAPNVGLAPFWSVITNKRARVEIKGFCGQAKQVYLGGSSAARVLSDEVLNAFSSSNVVPCTDKKFSASVEFYGPAGARILELRALGESTTGPSLSCFFPITISRDATAYKSFVEASTVFKLPN